MRAGVQNPDMVGALGISLQPYMMTIAGIGIGLAGLAGVLLAPIYSIHPAMGQEIITPAFVVVVIGGLGSFWGVVVAAIMVGLVKGITIGLGFTQWSTAVIYLMMLLSSSSVRAACSASASSASSEAAMNPTARDYLPLAIAAIGLAALPSLMHAIGLGTTSATEIVVFAIACMALNILVGTTGFGLLPAMAPAPLAAHAAGLDPAQLATRPVRAADPCWRWSSSGSSPSASAR